MANPSNSFTEESDFEKNEGKVLASQVFCYNFILKDQVHASKSKPTSKFTYDKPSYISENSSITLRFTKDNTTMEIVEDDLRFLFYDKEKKRQVQKMGDLLSSEAGTFHFRWTNKKMYECEVLKSKYKK